MKRKEKAPVFAISISDTDEKTGVSLISFVSKPAIEADFVALSEAVKLAKDKHKQILTGPVLIPDKQVFRLSEDEEPFYIQFAADTIERIRNKFHKNNFTQATNDEHALALDGNYVVESWIISDTEKDKAVAVGLSGLPVGTWMVSYHVPDADYWEKEILSGNKRGFSLEGFFDYEEVKEQLSKTEMTHKKEKGWFQRMSALKLSTIEMEDGTTIVHDPISNKLYSSDNTLLASGTYKTAQGVTFKVETSVSTYQWFYQEAEKLAQIEMKKNEKKPGLIARMMAKLTAMLALATMTLEDGSSIEVDEDTKEVFALDADGNRGAAVADGTYTLEDGTTIDVVDGKLKEAAAEEEMAATDLSVGSYNLPGGDVLTVTADAYAIVKADASEEMKAADVEALKAAHVEALKKQSDELAKLSATVEAQKVTLSKKPAASPVKLGGDKGEPEDKLTIAKQHLAEARRRAGRV